jgi:hypothetical protein
LAGSLGGFARAAENHVFINPSHRHFMSIPTDLEKADILDLHALHQRTMARAIIT